MAYVNLECSDPFSKRFREVTGNIPGTLENDLLHLADHVGKGVLLFEEISPGIEILAANFSLLTEDLVFNFLPGGEASSYILGFHEMILSGETDGDRWLPPGIREKEPQGSFVCLADMDPGKRVVYAKDRQIRSLLLRVGKDRLSQLTSDEDGYAFRKMLYGSGKDGPVRLPIHYQYRLLIGDFLEKVRQHPFRKLFAIRNISTLFAYLSQQIAALERLGKEGTAMSERDIGSLWSVEQYLCIHYRKEFPGIGKLSRISAMSPTNLKTKFKKYYGETLFNYYQKNKLEQAKRLLDQRLPVKVVAHEIGYSTPSHFTLAFKKVYGYSPSSARSG